MGSLLIATYWPPTSTQREASIANALFIFPTQCSRVTQDIVFLRARSGFGSRRPELNFGKLVSAQTVRGVTDPASAAAIWQREGPRRSLIAPVARRGRPAASAFCRS